MNKSLKSVLGASFTATSTNQKSILPYSILGRRKISALSSDTVISDFDTPVTTIDEIPLPVPAKFDNVVDRALIFSSFTDGVLENEDVRDFVLEGLVSKYAHSAKQIVEERIQNSAEQSSCCGPTDVDALDLLETVDKQLKNDGDTRLSDKTISSLLSVVEDDGIVPLKLLYIPTAMYALRADSSSTPGKQRQRARYDAKQRRKQLETYLVDMFKDKKIDMNIISATLDLDDGSIKQTSCSSSDETLPITYPSDGKDALCTWSPHIIYVEGGNTFWLTHCVEKGEWGSDLIKACSGPDGAFYFGKSAGAILAGSTVETATWKQMDDPSIVPSKSKYGDWIGSEGLDMLGGLNIFPHMASKWEDLISQQSLKNVVVLNDWDVCCIQGDLKKARIMKMDSE